MSRASSILEQVKELYANWSPLTDTTDLKTGLNVRFKVGTAYAGMVGLIVAITGPNEVSVKLGGALRTHVKVSDLEQSTPATAPAKVSLNPEAV